MEINLHPNARTTPAIRLELQNSDRSTAELADIYNLHRQTVEKWRNRETTTDATHCPNRLHTTLSKGQEAVVVELRKLLLLPLDDLLVVTQEFINPDVSRSGLSRCLRRHGVSSLQSMLPEADNDDKPKHKTFKDYDPGFIHVDIKYLPQMPDENSRSYLFVAIDRATRWVYVEIHKDKTALSAKRFLSRLTEKAPFKIEKVLTDNGKEFTDRFCATGQREPTGHHLFDQVCNDSGIEHRLTKPRTPQTNGMVERFNGRIAEVLATTRFDSAESLTQTITRYVRIYNHHIPQKALGHISPVDALKNWQQDMPELFKKKVYNHTGLDI
jgi:transposase-like protein